MSNLTNYMVAIGFFGMYPALIVASGNVRGYLILGCLVLMILGAVINGQVIANEGTRKRDAGRPKGKPSHKAPWDC
jgi:xanthine/uracil/vitamin C permease (AzgA family)